MASGNTSPTASSMPMHLSPTMSFTPQAFCHGATGRSSPSGPCPLLCLPLHLKPLGIYPHLRQALLKSQHLHSRRPNCGADRSHPHKRRILTALKGAAVALILDVDVGFLVQFADGSGRNLATPQSFRNVLYRRTETPARCICDQGFLHSALTAAIALNDACLKGPPSGGACGVLHSRKAL